MNKQQIAELILDARSLWQMYYVEGIIAHGYNFYNFWCMKNEIAELSGLDQDLKNGCPLCKYFFDDDCKRCPLDWPRTTSGFPPCEQE
jgi:hypothetical protein